MPRLAIVSGIVLASVLAAACREQASVGSTSVSIQSPADGATVSSPMQLSLSADGVEIGPPESGNMHFHAYVDGSADYVVVDDVQSAVPVPGGEHTVRVVLAHPNHEETDASASVTVTVSGGGASPSPGGGYPGDGGEGGGGGGGGGYKY